MKKICCAIRVNYRKFKYPKTSYIFKKPLVPSIICNKCDKDEKIIKEEQSLEILKFLSLTENI